MTRFALIDTNSGYVWHVCDADSPEAACAIAHTVTGNTYTEADEWSSVGRREGGDCYDVYEAPAGFTIQNGQDDDEIERVEALPRIGRFKHRDAV